MKHDFGECIQLLGGYFHQDWTDEFRSDDEAVKAMLKAEPMDMFVQASGELRALLAAEFSEQDLANILTDTIGCYFAPAAVGLTYRQWLESVLKLWDAG